MKGKDSYLWIYCIMVVTVCLAAVISVHLVEEGMDNRAHIKANSAARVAELCNKECEIEKVEARQRISVHAAQMREREILGRIGP